MIGLIIYATGEVEIIKYNDNIFKFYNIQLYINELCFIYCKHMGTYNYTANYLINIMNNKINIVNDICGDVYIFKVDENKKIITFNNDEVKDIMQLVVNG